MNFVGSVPLKPAARVFEALAKGVGAIAPRLPDGEQAGWLSLARETFARHPALEPGGEVPLEPSAKIISNNLGLQFTATTMLVASCLPCALRVTMAGPPGVF